MAGKLERRFASVQLRMADDDDDGDGVIEGYAAVHFDGDKRNQSQDLGGFRERLQKGCFERALKNVSPRNDGGDVKCLINHSPNLILGRTSMGTVQLASDAKGLHFRCDLGPQSYAQDLRTNIRAGNVTQCSFGFFMDPDDPDAESWDYDQDDAASERYRVRTIHHISSLSDVSPCYVDVAYPATNVNARSILFPEGSPAAVLRALGHDNEAQFAFARSQRRNLINRVIGQ